MLVRYKNQNILYMELIVNKMNEEGKPIPVIPEFKKLKITRNHIHFLPGVSEITEDEWIVVKHHNQDLIKSGVLEEVGIKTQAAPGKPAKVADTLSELTSKNARELVKECIDLPTLQKWAMTDSRADIRVLIDKQIQSILKREGKDETDLPETIFEEATA